MEQQKEGVYELVTILCEKLCTNQTVPSTKIISKKLRKKAFEILLSKRVIQQGIYVF